MSNFVFNLGDRVGFTNSDECGKIEGRAEYNYCENSYLVEYRDGKGCTTSGWFMEHLLVNQD